MVRIVDFDLNVPASVEDFSNNNQEVLTLEIDLNVNLDVNGEIPSNINGDGYTSNTRFDLNMDGNGDEDIGAAEDIDTLNPNQDNLQEQTHKKKRLNSSNAQRQAIYMALLERSLNGNLKRDTTSVVASLFTVSIRTVQRIWKQAKNNSNYGVIDVSHKRTKNCGRKRININLDQIRELNLKQRTSLDSLACALNISRTTLFRNFRKGVIRRHSNSIKPFLKEENKKTRLQFCLSMLERNSLPHDPTFVAMYNIIHIDEKWFYLTKKSQVYYLLPDEEDPMRTCKSKNFITKVMFLAAVARPRFDPQGNELFSEKIGLFPFIIKEPARRSSVNRVAGTLETKVVNSVGKNEVRSLLIEKVLPAIRAKWPSVDSRNPIFIQQDNARTHVPPNDPEFCQAASQDGFDIRLMCQPANSPDLNVLDLGFFRAIQSLQHKESPSTIDELVTAVENAFETFSVIKSNRIFLSLQLCMIETMKAKGANRYKIPHLKKATLERENRLPRQMKCDPALVQDVNNWLSVNVVPN